MLRMAAALFVGLLFGAGLALSDMVNPGRVQGFLDISGKWDPSLVFVMASAILPSAIGYLVRRRMNRPLFEKQFFVPQNRSLDPPLLTGATLFGVGWGLAGFCPGPALAGLALGAWQAWLFVAAMFAGMALHRAVATAFQTPSLLQRG